MHRMNRWTNLATVLPVVLAVVLALTVVLAGCGGDSTTTTTSPPATETTADPGSAIDAAALFSSNCASCHGADGSGNVGPDLRALSDAAAIAAQIEQGGGAMPAFSGTLSADEIGALADYVIGLE